MRDAALHLSFYFLGADVIERRRRRRRVEVRTVQVGNRTRRCWADGRTVLFVPCAGRLLEEDAVRRLGPRAVCPLDSRATLSDTRTAGRCVAKAAPCLLRAAAACCGAVARWSDRGLNIDHDCHVNIDHDRHAHPHPHTSMCRHLEHSQNTKGPPAAHVPSLQNA